MTNDQAAHGSAAALEALTHRLELLEDDKAIRELLARYGFNADQGRSDSYVALYTEDGALDYTHVMGAVADNASEIDCEPNIGQATRRLQGHEQLGEFIRDPSGHRAIEGSVLHFMGMNLVTRIQGDVAVAESYNMTVIRRGRDYVLLNAAVNRWRLAKSSGRWHIRECFRRSPGALDFDHVLVTQE